MEIGLCALVQSFRTELIAPNIQYMFSFFTSSTKFGNHIYNNSANAAVAFNLFLLCTIFMCWRNLILPAEACSRPLSSSMLSNGPHCAGQCPRSLATQSHNKANIKRNIGLPWVDRSLSLLDFSPVSLNFSVCFN